MTKRMLMCVASLALLFGTAFGQNLEKLAPADTIVSLGWSSQSEFMGSLGDDLHALDWMSAGETLEKLAGVLAELGDFPELADVLDAMEMMEAQDEAMSEFFAFCPAAEDLMPKFEGVDGHVPFDALLSVGMTSFSPIPSVTAILDLDQGYAPLMVELRETLFACAQETGEFEISTLEQEGSTLYVLGDASDFPVVIGSVDNLFFAGTNPETLRGVIRKANGADEASFADSRLAQEMMRFDQAGNDLSFSIDLAKLADLAEGFAGFIIDSDETEYLVNRGLSMLRTLGGVAGQVTASADGLVSESVWAINKEGGDPALVDYILCETCDVSTPFLAPSGSVAVSSSYIPWRELYAYAETWVTDLEQITGEQVDIKAILSDEFGFDLDVGLFNWLGSEFHTVVLEPFSPNINTMFYGQQQYMFVPVSSVEAAEAGMAELEAVFAGLMELGNEFGAFDDLSNEFGMEGMGADIANGMISVRAYDYKGTEINRVRFSINSDIGYAFVGNYLVVGSPAKSVEAAVDTFMGGRTITSDAMYRDARSRADLAQGATIFSVSEDQSSVYGLADLLAGASQPLAFAVVTGLETGFNDDFDAFLDDDFDFEEFAPEPYYADLYDITPEPFMAPGSTAGVLEEADLSSAGFISDFYQLTDLNVGDEVTVSLASDTVDTYLFLIDSIASEYIDENDDSFDSIGLSEVIFTVEEGVDYWLEVSSFNGDEQGDYQLEVTVSEGMMAEDAMTDDTMDADMTDMDMMDEHMHETPSFAELLDLFDLMPATVRIIGDHLSTSEGFSTIDGDTVYSRSVTHIQW